MAPLPIATKVGSPRVPCNVNDNDHSASQPEEVNHTVADHTPSLGHEALTSDLPFRTVEWGRDNGGTSSSASPRLASPFEESHRRTSVYAPGRTSPSITTPLPSYVRSPSTPTQVKCRSASFAGTSTPSTKIKEEEDEGTDLPNWSTPPLTGRRGSAPSEGQSRRISRDKVKSWKKKREEQKMRLKVDAEQYEAEQAALFSAARRQRQDPLAPVTENGSMFIKREHRDEE
ncbi:MAG: hypothetical protein Q9172_001634 [Xanthocarpia lactea]